MSTAPLAPHHRRTVLRVIVVTQLCLALVVGLGVALAYRSLDSSIDPGPPIPEQDPKPQPIGGEPLNVLIMGSDSRDGAGNDIDGLGGGGRRSDTTILLHISGDRKQVYGVSLPRDALVARPDCEGPDGETIPGGDLEMFNAAFSLGGETCTVAMVHELTGVYIDHYVSIDFNGFKDMVDAIHGVTVCIPKDVDDDEHDIHLDAGTQELDGEQALSYVRERYQLSANSDIGRMKRQQAFIASMINKVVSAGTLSRPTRVYDFMDAATGSITPDPGLASLAKLSKLGYEFRRTDLDDIVFITVPFQSYEPDPNRLVWAPEAKRLWKLIIADKPLTKAFRDQLVSAAKPPGSGGGGGKPDADANSEAEANGLCA